MSSIGPIAGAASLPAPPASAGVNVAVLSIANQQGEIVLELLEAASATSQAIQSESAASPGQNLNKVV